MPRQKKQNLSSTALKGEGGKEKKQEKITESGPKKEPKVVKGMRDILPTEQEYWTNVKNVFAKLSEDYSFQKIDTPVIEKPELFLSKKDADNVEEGVCVFGGKGKERICLRPEIRTSVARASVMHELIANGVPVKLSYLGPIFKCQKEKTLKYKSFYSLGYEVLGDDSSAIDAHLIMVGYTFFKELGLEVIVNINSIGDEECREIYTEALLDYFKQYKNKLSTEDKKNLRKNPLKLLESKDKKHTEMIEGVPQIVDYLNDEGRDHFFRVLEYLDDLDIPYNLDPILVSDCDYYNKTVFEFHPVRDGVTGKNPIGGGGRYDTVTQKFSSLEVPACGWSVGIERIISEIRSQKIELLDKKPADVFIAQIGEQARRKAMVLFEEFRQKGIKVKEGFVYNSLKVQLEIANREGIPYILILGQKEVLDGTILFRDIEGGIQETLDLKRVVEEMEKNLIKNKISIVN